MKRLLLYVIALLPVGRLIRDTKETNNPVTLKIWFFQRFLGINKSVPWPVHFSSTITGIQNISIGVDTAPGYAPGCYIQGIGKIHIGDYTQIAPNVGIISGNHDPYQNNVHIASEISIGNYCWIGMNAVILPGVKLGDFTIVGAGAVVTKSFPDGYCVIAGNPARELRKLEPARCVRYRNSHEFIGYKRK